MALPTENPEGKRTKTTVRVIEKTVNVPLPVMVPIPEGEFVMGTSDEQIMQLYWKEEWAQEWHEDGMFRVEQPQHYVTLPSYEIGKYPVTNSDYYRFVFQFNYKLPKHWIGFRFPEGMENHPMTGISKTDAEAYCAWLNKNTKREYRLPTEAEWEKAARGPDDRIFPWGNEFDPWRCNTLESGLEGTSSVDVYIPAGLSPYSVADMVGNVFEWTSSRLLPYPFDPEPPALGKERPRYVVRGGAWYYTRRLARCASRESYVEDYISPAVGFRLCRSLE